ncbi:MAG: hypothetical protein M3P08_14980, partial [Thermoproteota archaeon]|nr:hypothetical protein [Thermoproteota archaeon]
NEVNGFIIEGIVLLCEIKMAYVKIQNGLRIMLMIAYGNFKSLLYRFNYFKPAIWTTTFIIVAVIVVTYSKY